MKSSRQYVKSNFQLERAERTIPLGSQTFSKSRTQFPPGISPLFIDRAKGSSVWDVDGNHYVDMINSLASVTIGYCDKRTNAAVKSQLKKGSIFSLPGVLESEVSELLVEMVPSAEMVRFGKNGSDATAAAIRLARAYTGRDHVLVCGYHGWQDWYIGSTTRNKGVPDEVSTFTHQFEFNNIESLRSLFSALSGQVAAVIMEPMNSRWPLPGYLEEVKLLSKNSGAVLIFDEIITGFRFHRGGAQELFGVIPDLTTLGKGMANGFPLSAIAGKREIMMEMREIFFSGTFGGDLISLAASKSVLERHKTEDVCSQISKIGKKLSGEITKIINEFSLEDVLTIQGHDSWKFLEWNSTNGISSAELKTYFMQEMFENGVLVVSTNNISLSHSGSNFRRVIETYQKVLSSVAGSIKSGTLKEKLKVQPLPPLFKIR